MDYAQKFDEFPNMAGLACWQAQHSPSQNVITYLSDSKTISTDLTYQHLDQQARLLAAWLQTLTVEGDRAILLFPEERDLLIGLYGCFYAGITAVFTDFPEINMLPESFQAAAGQSAAALVLTTSAIQSIFESQSSSKNPLTWLAIDSPPAHISLKDWQMPASSHETPALLVFSSQSTTQSWGTLVTHGDLLLENIMKDNTLDMADRILDPTQNPARGEYVAPRTPLEKALVGIWSSVLNKSRIGIHDNFYDLGGDSLDGAMIVVQI